MSEILSLESNNGSMMYFNRDKIWVVTWDKKDSSISVYMEGQERAYKSYVTTEEAEAFTDKFYAGDQST